MNWLKNRTFVGYMIGMLILASTVLAGQGFASPRTVPLAVGTPLPSSFVFEGRLGTLSGSFDFQWRMFDSLTGGTQVSPIVAAVSGLPVDSGEYRVIFGKFGADVFNGDARYLEVKFRTHTTNTNAPFTTQSPRTLLSAVPYALNAVSAWNIKGNAGTSSGTNFLGTTDASSLVVKTNNVERLRVDTSGNVGVGTSGPIAKLEASSIPGGIGLLGTSDVRGVIGRLGSISCGGTNFGVGGCGADSGIGVLGDSNSRGVVGTLGHTSCAGVYAVGGCNDANTVGVYGHSNSDKGVWGNSSAGGNARGVVGTLGDTSCAGSYGVGGCTGNAAAYAVFGRSLNNGAIVGSSDTGDVFIGVTGDSETHVARIDHNGRVFANGGFQANGADVAEFIPVTDAPQPGDVVEINQDQPGTFRIATVANSTAVAGVVTTRPGLSLSMNDMAHTDANAPQLALVGRVPVKVTAENGAIHAGDLLVSSSLPGYAMRAPRHPEAGTIIGKATEGLASGTGKIMVLVMLR